jgi:glyoxylase-like metal-dependent hydrolase (beta-lactamase superfamily II)
LAAGDILFNGFFPFIDAWANSDTKNWITTTNQLHQKNYDFFIPGHGNLAHSDVMKKQAQFFIDLRSEIKTAIAKGLSLEQMQSEIKMSEYSSYGFPDLLKGGIKAVYDELIKENS